MYKKLKLLHIFLLKDNHFDILLDIFHVSLHVHS